MRRRDLVAALAGGAIVLVLAGGIAWAAIPGAGNVYTACMLKNVGTVRLIDKSLPPGNVMSHCKQGLEVEVSWNQQGQAGTNGAAGTNGTNGVSPTVTPLAVGDANCPTGGASIIAADNSTAFVCNGQAGADGDPFSGTFTAGNYSIDVTTTGITLSGPNSRKIVLDNTGMTLDNGALPVTIRGSDVKADAVGGVAIKAGTTFSAEALATASLKGTAAVSVESAGGVAELNGAIVKLGGSCTAGIPVAKVGSAVAGTTVTTGDTHTLVC